MSTLNQQNKEAVWDFWQKLNYAGIDDVPDLIKASVHENVNWNGSAPIDHLEGSDALFNGFYEPLLTAFPDLKRTPYIFMGGVEDGETTLSSEPGSQWVSGCGYMTGTFAADWLGIPATGKQTNIHFGQFYRMEDGKIAESFVMYDIVAVMRQAGYQVLPPAPGAEGGKVPEPINKDGILLTQQDSLESRKSCQSIVAMGNALNRYRRDRDGADMRSMEQWNHWHPDMKWYGPAGIGACMNRTEFEDFHQRPWLHGFGDRTLSEDGGGREMGLIGEGKWSSGGIWDTVFSYHHGEYAGIPATGKLMTIRDFDWWKREGELLTENWIPIDMIDLCRQMSVDLFERLRVLIDEKKRRGW